MMNAIRRIPALPTRAMARSRALLPLARRRSRCTFGKRRQVRSSVPSLPRLETVQVGTCQATNLPSAPRWRRTMSLLKCSMLWRTPKPGRSTREKRWTRRCSSTGSASHACALTRTNWNTSGGAVPSEHILITHPL